MRPTLARPPVAALALLVVLLAAGCTPWYRPYGFASPSELGRPSAIPGLVRALREGSVEASLEAGRALVRLGAPAVPALAAELRRGSGIAAWVLGELGPTARPALPELVGALGAADHHLREAAVTALGKLGREGAPAIPALLRVLERDGEHEVRREVPPALVSIGQPAAEVLAALERAGRDARHSVRRAARSAHQELSFAALAAARRGGTTTPAGPPARGTILAVFDVQDAAGGLAAGTLEQLTEYLVTRLAASGFRVVPRDQLRARLVEEKRRSYRDCVDQSCQLELGRALAAQKSVATKLLRLDARCALTAILYDLRSETAERAASAETGCAPGQLLDGIRDLVARLAAPAR